MKNSILLLTGTVNSSNVSFMDRDDTDLRLKDYQQAISKWILLPDIKIVFVENSNFPKEKLGKYITQHKNFEYLTYNGQNFSRDKGKGFGEISSFQYAFENSLLLNKADLIIKCNGRYFFKGFEKLTNGDFDVIGDYSENLSLMESKVFAFKKAFFYDYFQKHKDQIDDSKRNFFEHALGRAVHELLANGGSWSAIPFPLIVEGISGTNNAKHNTIKNILKIKLRFFLKKL